MSKFQAPKGMRDFAPQEVLKREYLFDIITQAFKRHGFMPLETPTMENLETLTGKYGEEGDRLIFKVLNSGDYLKKIRNKDEKEREEIITAEGSKKLTPHICEKGLRYDLTVPFARFVSQNHGQLALPFKRYQIQPVWRAERPQKGRYREFTQCDGDIIGDSSLLCELELLQIYENVFSQLKLHDTQLIINNRKILAAIAEMIGASDKLTELTIAIDKLDKIGRQKVEEELVQKGLDSQQIAKLSPLFELSEQMSKQEKADNQSTLKTLDSILGQTEMGQRGIAEMRELIEMGQACELKTLYFDPLLARGLDYYTGTIVEVKAKNTQIGSLGGGGRYDNLTDIFGVKDLSGVGVSFGADRILLLLEERELFPENLETYCEVLIIHFGKESQVQHLQLANKLRMAGISTELYPSAAKMKKQMKYANQKAVNFVILQGEEEIQNGQITVKNMHTGEQKTQKVEEFIQSFAP